MTTPKFQIGHLAKLARMALDNRAVEKYVLQLSAVLGYVAKAKKVQSKQLSQEIVVDFSKWLDRGGSRLNSTLFWKNVPLEENGLIKVKSVFRNEQ